MSSGAKFFAGYTALWVVLSLMSDSAQWSETATVLAWLIAGTYSMANYKEIAAGLSAVVNGTSAAKQTGYV